MESWKNYFEERILDRGYNYYENGAVKKLKKTSAGYKARVKGTVNYKVKIKVKNGEIEYMSCDCPYADSGKNCKHMAAVIYEVEKKVKQSVKDNLKNIVNSIPEAELRYYVYDLAKNNRNVENYIRINYGNKINADYIKSLKKGLRAIIRNYSDNGYIEWEAAFDFISDVRKFMGNNIQSLIDRNFLMEAFGLTNYVFDKIINQPMNYSVSIAGDCEYYWLEIIKKIDDKSKDKIFRWFNSKLLKHQLEDFAEEFVYDFFMKEFQEERYLKIKKERYRSLLKIR